MFGSGLTTGDWEVEDAGAEPVRRAVEQEGKEESTAFSGAMERNVNAHLFTIVILSDV